MRTLGELAAALQLGFSGDADRQLTGLAPLVSAGPDQLAFLSNSKYESQLARTGAGAVILHPDFVDLCPVDCLISEAPYVTFARVTRIFDRSPTAAAGIHPSATISADASIDAEVSIGPNVVVEAGARISRGVVLGAGAYVGHDSHLGAATRLHPHVVIYHDVRLGEHCVVHSQSVLGGDGFGYAPGSEGWEKISQLGGVRIGDRVEIGACTAIDRGALDHTVIEDGVIIDNQVQIAHNCRIGKNTAIAGCVGLAGSTIIGANCTLAGGVGVAGHLEICDSVHVSAMSLVTKSILEPGSYSAGTPMMNTREWRQSAVRFSQLNAMHRRLAALEKSVKTP